MPDEKDENIEFLVPDMKKIRCLDCKWALPTCLEYYCVKYNFKPKAVLYGNEDCEHYEKREIK